MDSASRSAILLLGLFFPAVDAFSQTPSLAQETVRKELLVENFDVLPVPTKAWRAYTDDPANRVRFSLNASDRRGVGRKSLYLSYSFVTSAASTIGLRMKLNSLDAADYDHLAFWVKGDTHRGYADTFRVEFRRPDPAVPRMMERGSFIVTGISNEWRQIEIPLNRMTGIRDWSNLSEFVITFQSRRSAVRQGAYYIEDLTLLKTGKPGPSIRDKVATPRKQAWEALVGGHAAAAPDLQARLTGWPSRALVDKHSLPADNNGFLWRLAQDTWRGLVALSDRAHGLPLDTVRFGDGTVALAAARIGDYTNVTNIGLHLIAVSAAFELKLVDRQQALALLDTTLTTLERLETYRGFFYNYYDTTTLERTSHFVSFVDSSWLTAGLMVVRMTFPELYSRCTALIQQGDYGFFYDNVEQHMHHGYYVNLSAYAEYHYGALYTESRLGSLIAIGKGDVPAEHWFKLLRTFPPDYAWQSQTPHARKAKSVEGYDLIGGYYQWQGFRYVPSWGGSMFEALMPTLVLDEQRYAPDSLGKNDEVHAVIQRRYARMELGYPIWGLSPSSMPEGDSYTEYGVKMLGSRGYRAGAVTPHAAALALTVTPEPAIANLRELAQRYALYGEYGLYDAVNPLTGKAAYKYLALDQSMLFIALANYLQDHCVQKRFAADPIARRVLALIGHEHFFD